LHTRSNKYTHVNQYLHADINHNAYGYQDIDKHTYADANLHLHTNINCHAYGHHDAD